MKIFEKYGGFARVSVVVSAFYDKVLKSATLAPYFAGVDMGRLMLHQTKFMAQAMGGPTDITVQELRYVHARLRVTEAAFDEMLSILRRTFEEQDFAAEDVGAVCAEVAANKTFIVGRM